MTGVYLIDDFLFVFWTGGVLEKGGGGVGGGRGNYAVLKAIPTTTSNKKQ